MTKWANNSVWNALLAKINTANKVLILPSFTTDLATANSQALGSAPYSPGTVTFQTRGSERLADMPGVENISIIKTGAVSHVAYVNSSEILLVTDIAGQTVTQGGTANLTGVQLKAEDI